MTPQRTDGLPKRQCLKSHTSGTHLDPLITRNRYTKEGQATAQLGVAVNRRWQDRVTQEWQEATSFFDVVCWRDWPRTWP